MIILAAALFVVAPFTAANACDSCGCSSCGSADKMMPIAKNDIVETAAKAGSFKTLLAAAKAAGLVETLKGDGPYTVFAPNDDAFARLPEGTVASLLKDKAKLAAILKYHVVPGRITAKQVVTSQWLATAEGQSLFVRATGEGVMIDGASIIKTDIKASNGIIHVIDKVVLPRKNIVQTASDAKVFKTLLAAAKAAGLAEALAENGPFTVFAPTDDAFKKLPEGTVEALLKDKAKLAAILKYHVVSGRILSTDLTTGVTKAKSLEGQSIKVTRAADGKVKADGANVVKANIIAGNGVIHVIDAVILPK
jgi:uncharacterized surface protein with fasciclin (FAS1) repeats